MSPELAGFGALTAPEFTEPCAVAAILQAEDGRYLMQHRDDKIDIELPGFWGLFGGSMSEAEEPEQAICRELREELEFLPDEMFYFTKIYTDLRVLAGRTTCKYIFYMRITAFDIGAMRQHEGQGMALWKFDELVSMDVVPGDVYALLLHSRAGRLRKGLVINGSFGGAR